MSNAWERDSSDIFNGIKVEKATSKQLSYITTLMERTGRHSVTGFLEEIRHRNLKSLEELTKREASDAINYLLDQRYRGD